jgi:hypothetical protein
MNTDGRLDPAERVARVVEPLQGTAETRGYEFACAYGDCIQAAVWAVSQDSLWGYVCDGHLDKVEDIELS